LAYESNLVAFYILFPCNRKCLFFTELLQPLHVISSNCFWCYVVCTTWLLYFLCHSDIVQTVKFCDLWHHILSFAQKVILTYFIPLLVALCMVLRKYCIVVLADLFFQKPFSYKRYEHTINFLIYLKKEHNSVCRRYPPCAAV
jgi:hypothetical protein